MSANWSWREDTVDSTCDHFELRYCSANDSEWDEWVPVALVGPPISGVFVNKFLLTELTNPKRVWAL